MLLNNTFQSIFLYGEILQPSIAHLLPNNQKVFDTLRYRAPLHRAYANLEDIDHRAYEVFFQPGHTFIEYDKAISFNVELSIENLLLHNHKLVYLARWIDDDMLDAIRSDIEVELVKEPSRSRPFEIPRG